MFILALLFVYWLLPTDDGSLVPRPNPNPSAHMSWMGSGHETKTTGGGGCLKYSIKVMQE